MGLIMTVCFRLFLLASVFALSLSFTNTAGACSFLGGVEPPCSAYWKADAVFVGVVYDITEAPREPKEMFDKLLLHFSVEQAYRGVESAEVEVATITGTSCDTKFQKGERWLVYAVRKSATARLEVSVRTTVYSHADEDLSYIRSVSEGRNESSIIVRAFDSLNTPLQGIRVEIEGEGMNHEEVTDKEGRVRVAAVKPGRYLIRGIFPGWTAITGYRVPSRVREGKKYSLVEFQEEIKAGRCGYVELLVHMPAKRSDPR